MNRVYYDLFTYVITQLVTDDALDDNNYYRTFLGS